jgi:hypothetical protein
MALCEMPRSPTHLDRVFDSNRVEDAFVLVEEEEEEASSTCHNTLMQKHPQVEPNCPSRQKPNIHCPGSRTDV